MKNIALRFLLCIILLGLIGCPKIAHIEIYNNTPVVIEIDSAGYKRVLSSGESFTLKYTGESLSVVSELGKWFYPRNVPHGGNYGIYFDGTLRAQINADGAIYALKKSDIPPVESFSEQPEGYPLTP